MKINYFIILTLFKKIVIYIYKMDYPKPIRVKDYFDIHNYYSDMYGHGRTIILMQVGSFHVMLFYLYIRW
jgi:hypothetical protein